ncbi:serine hydrolase domain-containing protein, partial [Burkholderia sp. MR1-5-21]
WGLGWDSVAESTLDSVGVAAWNKGGTTTFFQSEFFVLPQARMAILLTGSMRINPRKIVEAILLNALVEDGTLGAMPPLFSTTMPPVATPPDVTSLIGIYGNEQNPLRVQRNADGTLALDRWNGSKWVPLDDGATSFQYCNDGWWWSAGNTIRSYRFESVAATGPSTYLIERTMRSGAGYASFTIPLAQKLPDQAALDTAWNAHLQNPVWKVKNTDALAVQLSKDPGSAQTSLAQIPELPGYILFGNQPLVPLADDRGGMVLKIPMTMGRDLHEIVLTTIDGVATVTDGGITWVPA